MHHVSISFLLGPWGLSSLHWCTVHWQIPLSYNTGLFVNSSTQIQTPSIVLTYVVVILIHHKSKSLLWQAGVPQTPQAEQGGWIQLPRRHQARTRALHCLITIFITSCAYTCCCLLLQPLAASVCGWTGLGQPGQRPKQRKLYQWQQFYIEAQTKMHLAAYSH